MSEKVVINLAAVVERDRMRGHGMAEIPGEARLVLAEVAPGAAIVAPEGMQGGDSIPVPAAVAGRWITIGAGPDQDVVIRDEPRGIRRSHFRMIYRNGAYQIQSRLHPEGLWINDEHFLDCTARPLKEGDLVKVGHVTLRFAT
jgi:hypothetical protein